VAIRCTLYFGERTIEETFAILSFIELNDMGRKA
jgi:hypothetical protein